MEQELKYTRILVPVDGSRESLCAVRLAGEMARVLHATVYLLYVSPFDKCTDEGEVAWLPESVVRPAAEEAHEIFSASAALLPDAVISGACTVRVHRRTRSCASLTRRASISL